MDEPVAEPITLDEARALFPALTKTTYFATNGHGILPRPAAESLAQNAERLSRSGYGAAARLDANVDTVRRQVAELLHAEVSEIAFVRNTGEGLCLTADLIDWREGDEVLTFAGEYRSIVHAFQGAIHRGVTVRVANLEEPRLICPEFIERELTDQTRAVVLSWVRYDNGARADLNAIGRLLRSKGILFIVDGIQGTGVLPVDVHAAQVDFFCAGAHKWLLGVSGTGILYISQRAQASLIPTHLGVTSMKDEDTSHVTGDPYVVCPHAEARRVEEGSRNALSIAALGESLTLHERIGAEAIEAQVKAVTEHLCEGFEEAGGIVLSPRGEGEWSGILLLKPPSDIRVEDLLARLHSERISIGEREGALWGAAHYYNTTADADLLLRCLREV